MGILSFIGGGEVAGIAATTRAQTSIPSRIVIPAAGSTPVVITLNIYNNNQTLEDPDLDEVAISIANSAGTDRTSRLFKENTFSNALDVIGAGDLAGLSQLEKVNVGTYRAYYQSSSTDSDEALIFTLEYVENTYLIRFDIGSYADSNGSDLATIESKVDTVDTVVDGIKAVTDLLPDAGALSSLAQDSTVAKDATVAKAAALTTVDGKVDTIDTVVDGIQTDLDNATDGLGAIKTAVDANQTDLTSIESKVDIIDTNVDAIKAVTDALSVPTAAANADAVWDEATAGHTTAGSFGKNATDTYSLLGTVDGKVDTIDTVVDGIQSDLDNGTDGLGAIKTAVDAISTDTVGDRKATVDISQNATTTETIITGLDLTTASRSYTLENVVLKSAAVSGETVTVRLYEEINGSLAVTNTKLIHDLNYTKHLSLIDMFGKEGIASEKIRITLESSAGTIPITGQATYNEGVV